MLVFHFWNLLHRSEGGGLEGWPSRSSPGPGVSRPALIVIPPFAAGRNPDMSLSADQHKPPVVYLGLKGGLERRNPAVGSDRVPG